MLALKNIVKDYRVASETVHALKGLSINFRANEFVSILGPSGCGKTTLLNIIGGLDRYTSGDLVINGKSTKLYSDRDWDVYRNHRVGFIFQSYNLIPHQTILGNVELALTIAGIDKEERIKRAKEALDRVGLKGQYKKRPNQLSGGQCQRVAIARALVNNPEILLADEPTGALDTVTSVQIMDLIKEISKERLVIMVTHNPDLAEKYSTRIVRMLDGNLNEDTMPYSDEEEVRECEQLALLEKAENEQVENPVKEEGEIVEPTVEQKKPKVKKEKAKMSLLTAFRLSARNLISKKGRTAMVGFAGSIGIIGIALVLSFSAGIKGYIASMQDDMLSGNPITITENTYDLEALSGMMETNQKVELAKKPNKVAVDSMVEYFIKMGDKAQSLLIKNDLDQKYIDYVKAMPKDYYAAIDYGYGINAHHNVYTDVVLQSEQTGVDQKGKPIYKNETKSMSITALTSLYTELLKKSSFEDYAQYVSMFIPNMEQAPSSEEYIRSQYTVYGDIATEKDEIMLVINKEDTMSDLLLARLGYYTQEEFLNVVYKAQEDLDIEKGLITAYDDFNPDIYKQYFDYEELRGKTFTWYPNSQVYEKTVNPLMPYTYNYLEGEGWADNDKAVQLKVVGVLKPNDNVMFGSMMSGIYYTQAFNDYVVSVNSAEENGIVDSIKAMSELSPAQAVGLYASVYYSMEYYHKGEKIVTPMPEITSSGLKTDGCLGTSLLGTAEMMQAMFATEVDYDDMVKALVRTLGGNTLPNSVKIFPISFDNKNLVTNYLKEWNGKKDITVNGVTYTDEDRQDIEYTDTLELIIPLINTMIDIVSYALIAFTSVSLLVSTVMIGIITYVSVVERIKEIGVIRSLGGRKKDVSHLFNAETFIIGLLAGIIGILASVLISEVVNLILYPLIDIRRIAILPVSNAIILIVLSVVLTLISGLVPARSAANKDPVNALRTE
ncbi:MAG: ABC transporter ATP-binding protein/permease [Clostridia bacterium]|nr:ABC transporter ATP-binding protein/permease [Clostridia bacterium]